LTRTVADWVTVKSSGVSSSALSVDDAGFAAGSLLFGAARNGTREMFVCVTYELKRLLIPETLNDEPDKIRENDWPSMKHEGVWLVIPVARRYFSADLAGSVRRVTSHAPPRVAWLYAP
jgi:hypothetical protein